MCRKTTYYFRVDNFQGQWDTPFYEYPGSIENMDSAALLQDFINRARAGDYNAELTDKGLIALDTHTLPPCIHGWRFILMSYVGMRGQPQAIIVINDQVGNVASNP